MPTKRTFDLVVMTWIGLELAKGLVKMWARRNFLEPGTGTATHVAEAVLTELS